MDRYADRKLINPYSILHAPCSKKKRSALRHIQSLNCRRHQIPLGSNFEFVKRQKTASLKDKMELRVIS